MEGGGDDGDTERQEMNWLSKGQEVCRKCHGEVFPSATKEANISHIQISSKLYQPSPVLFY